MSVSNFVSVPPDSSGKKIRHYRVGDILVNISNTSIFLGLSEYDEIIGSTTGASAIYRSKNISPDGNYLHVTSENNINFQAGETLTKDSVVFASVISYNDIYQTSFSISDGNSPLNTLKIDSTGSLFSRFKDGDLSLDSFGNAQFSQNSVLKSYLFTYDSLNLDFTDYVISGGTLSYSGSQSLIKLITDTDNGSSIKRISNAYIPYTPLQSNFISIALACGDDGKEGVTRRWGLFDDSDGLYFELAGLTFSVNIKNSITSEVTKITQSDFSENKLVDSIGDLFQLKPSMFNLYWIDYQWQGVGVVRFGVYGQNGERLILHRFKNPNSLVVPYMKRGSLPFQICQFNTNITASSSEIKCSCVGISRQSSDVSFTGNIRHFSSTQMVTVTNQDTPLVTLSPMTLINGNVNRVSIIPIGLEFYVEGSPILSKFVLNGSLGTSSFFQVSEFTNIDYSATSISGGLNIDSTIWPVGYDSSNFGENIDRSLGISPDGLSSNTVTLTGKAIKGTQSDVFFVIRWKEVI